MPWLKINSIAIAFLIVALVGFIDASYLAIKFYTHTIPPCSVFDGCEQVTTSTYATIGGVSVALLGAIYYLVFVLGSVAYFDSKKENILAMLAWFAVFGLIASAYFISVQFFVIKALCIYCLFSAGTSTALFSLGLIYRRERAIFKQS